VVNARGKMPENGNWKAVHLSRSEVLELVYGKLMVIREEAESIEGEDSRPTERDLLDLIKSFRRIAVEAKRAASLIETHTHVAKAGHCVHCGKTYAEHDTDEQGREKRGGLLPNRRPINPQIEQARCLALQRLFESVELELYQPLPMTEVDLG
jgi:hypothetical protein